MNELDQLYQEVILDHYKNPRCKGALDSPTAKCALYNPLCGDQIDLSVAVDASVVAKIGFTGHGCSISQASASMMCDSCQGKSKAEVSELCAAFRSMMRGEPVPEETLGDSIALQGVRKFSARVKCAMLAWEAMEKCLRETEAPDVSNSLK